VRAQASFGFHFERFAGNSGGGVAIAAILVVVVASFP
jgi:hypothetical protein